jgi:hypothetical protein
VCCRPACHRLLRSMTAPQGGRSTAPCTQQPCTGHGGSRASDRVTPAVTKASTVAVLNCHSCHSPVPHRYLQFLQQQRTVGVGVPVQAKDCSCREGASRERWERHHIVGQQGRAARAVHIAHLPLHRTPARTPQTAHLTFTTHLTLPCMLHAARLPLNRHATWPCTSPCTLSSQLQAQT